MEDVLSQINVVMSFPCLSTVCLSDRIDVVQKSEDDGSYWKEGWDEFFWRIGETRELWTSHADQLWVLPEIQARSVGLTDKHQVRAQLNQRFLKPLQESICIVGNIRMLRHLTEDLKPALSLYAAAHGHLSILEFLISKHVWHIGTTLEAAKFGHVAVLELTQKKNKVFHVQTAWIAAKHNQFECLQFCLDADLMIPPETSAAAAQNGNLACLDILYQKSPNLINKDCLHWASQKGDVACLQFLIQKHHQLWDPLVTLLATQKDHVQVLKFTLHNNLTFHPNTSLFAAARQAIECLRFCRFQEEVPWHPCTYETALLTENETCVHIALQEPH